MTRGGRKNDQWIHYALSNDYGSILSLVFNQMCDDAEFALKTPVFCLLPIPHTHTPLEPSVKYLMKFGKVEANFYKASLHRMRFKRCMLCLMLHLKVCGLARLYFPYKCSTKSSFMWFGMQWTCMFKIWTSLTEGCFQFQMLTCALFV